MSDESRATNGLRKRRAASHHIHHFTACSGQDVRSQSQRPGRKSTRYHLSGRK
jgi:hypothetical protein